MTFRNFWKDARNQRAFLENIASTYKIKRPEDWGRISVREIEKLGGRGLVKSYSHSLYKTLSAVYPGLIFMQVCFII